MSLLCKQVAPSLSEDEIDLQGNIGERIFMGWADGCCSISIFPALIVNITSIEETLGVPFQTTHVKFGFDPFLS